VLYGEDSAVLIGLRAICFMGMCLMGTHLLWVCISWGTYLIGMHPRYASHKWDFVQEVGTNKL
jgi:hypothetical protein